MPWYRFEEVKTTFIKVLAFYLIPTPSDMSTNTEQIQHLPKT